MLNAFLVILSSNKNNKITIKKNSHHPLLVFRKVLDVLFMEVKVNSNYFMQTNLYFVKIKRSDSIFRMFVLSEIIYCIIFVSYKFDGQHRFLKRSFLDSTNILIYFTYSVLNTQSVDHFMVSVQYNIKNKTKNSL